jgi:hypothetical protein
MTDHNDLIILKLHLEEEHLDLGVWFEGEVNEYADGFELRMPIDEWEALGEPREVQFVVSTRQLGVRGGMIQ